MLHKNLTRWISCYLHDNIFFEHSNIDIFFNKKEILSERDGKIFFRDLIGYAVSIAKENNILFKSSNNKEYL